MIVKCVCGTCRNNSSQGVVHHMTIDAYNKFEELESVQPIVNEGAWYSGICSPCLNLALEQYSDIFELGYKNDLISNMKFLKLKVK
jgi:hypothetical protein